MFLTGFSSLLCYGSLDSPSVCKSASLESLKVCWEGSDGSLGNCLGTSLELSILSHDVGFATKSDEDCLVAVYLGDNSTL